MPESTEALEEARRRVAEAAEATAAAEAQKAKALAELQQHGRRHSIGR